MHRYLEAVARRARNLRLAREKPLAGEPAPLRVIRKFGLLFLIIIIGSIVILLYLGIRSSWNPPQEPEPPPKTIVATPQPFRFSDEERGEEAVEPEDAEEKEDVVETQYLAPEVPETAGVAEEEPESFSVFSASKEELEKKIAETVSKRLARAEKQRAANKLRENQ